MSNHSRRAVLAGIATAPALAAPALALSVKPAASIDADLIALEAEIMEVARQAEGWGAEHTRTEELMYDWRQENPRPEWSKAECEKATQHAQQVLDAVRDGRDHSKIAPVIHSDEHNAIFAKHAEREEAAEAECGEAEANTKFSECCSRLWDLTEKIASTPALTIEGIRIRSRPNARLRPL